MDIQKKPDVYNSIMYSFTITTKPQLYKFDGTEQYDLCTYHVAEQLESLSPEWSAVAELTPNGFNLHFHGIIVFHKRHKNHQKQFVDQFRGSKYVGFVNIKQIDDLDGWKVYLMKTAPEFKKLVGRPPIMKDCHKLWPNTLDGMVMDLDYVNDG